MFLDFANIEYYVIFIVLAGVLFSIDRSKMKVPKIRISSSIAAATISLIVIAIIVIALYGHAEYSKTVGITASSLSSVSAGNNLTYNATLQRNENVAWFGYPVLYFFDVNATEPLIGIDNSTNMRVGNVVGNLSIVNLSGHTAILFGTSSESLNISMTKFNSTSHYSQCAIFNATYVYLCPLSKSRT